MRLYGPYVCCNCGEVFDDPRTYHETHGFTLFFATAVSKGNYSLPAVWYVNTLCIAGIQEEK